MIDLLVILIFLFSYFPNIDIYNISIYQIFIWLFLVSYYKKIFNSRLDKKMIIFGIFLVFQVILIYIYPDEKIVLLNKLVPDQWYVLGGWEKFDYFSGKYEAIAQLIHVTEGILIYFLIKKEFLKIQLNKIKIYLFITLLLQYIFGIYQKYILNQDWISGTVCHSQAIGSLCSMIIIVFGFKKKKDIIVSILALLMIIISKKNSSLVTGILLILFYTFPKIFMKISLIANILISIIIPFYSTLIEYLYIIIEFLLRKGSYYTLNMRILIWKNVFLEIIKKDLILGTSGIITAFPENIIWYFLQPYGLIGVIILIYIFYTQKASNKYYLLIGILILQGISYYGLMVAPTSYTFFALLGYYRNQNKKEGDN